MLQWDEVLCVCVEGACYSGMRYCVCVCVEGGMLQWDEVLCVCVEGGMLQWDEVLCVCVEGGMLQWDEVLRVEGGGLWNAWGFMQKGAESPEG